MKNIKAVQFDAFFRDRASGSDTLKIVTRIALYDSEKLADEIAIKHIQNGQYNENLIVLDKNNFDQVFAKEFPTGAVQFSIGEKRGTPIECLAMYDPKKILEDDVRILIMQQVHYDLARLTVNDDRVAIIPLKNVINVFGSEALNS